MFVLEALALMFMTMPLVTWLYPQHVCTRIAVVGANFANVADDEAGRPASSKFGIWNVQQKCPVNMFVGYFHNAIT